MSAQQYRPVSEMQEVTPLAASAAVSPWYDPFGWFEEEAPPQVAKSGIGDAAKRMLENLPPELREEMEAEKRVQADLDAQTGRDRDRDGYRKAAARIGRGYTDEAPAFDGSVAAPLGTRDERLAVLDRLTQNVDQGEGGAGDDRCGATTLLAGAMLGGGNDGVKLLLDKASGSEGVDETTKMMLGLVQAKLKKGETLSDGDLRFVQEGLHQHLRHQDQVKGRTVEGRGGVDGSTLEELLREDAALSKMFADSDLGVSKIDNDGDDVGNHFVLEIGTRGSDDEAIYDPLARKSGHQLVTDPMKVNDYELASRQDFRPR